MVKILTGWLPVYHHLNKMMKTPLHCHLCNNDETIAHLFQCQARANWRNTFLMNLQQHLQKIQTPITLRDDLYMHLKNILDHDDEYEHFKHFTIFAGLVPISWGEQYSQQSGKTQHQTHIWLTKLCKWLIQQGHELWIQRNLSLIHI